MFSNRAPGSAPAIAGSNRLTVKKSAGLPTSSAPLGAPSERAPAAVAACQTHGRASYLSVVDGEVARAHTGSPLPLAAAIQTDAATLQPARLVRGLRRVALERGVRIYEGTPMVRLERATPARVLTPAGEITAGQVVVAAGAWAPRLIPELRRAGAVVGSTIVMSEPVAGGLTGDRLAEGEAFGDAQSSVHYVQMTPSGRILFGRGFVHPGPGLPVNGIRLAELLRP